MRPLAVVDPKPIRSDDAQLGATGTPPSDSFRMPTICVSLKFDFRMTAPDRSSLPNRVNQPGKPTTLRELYRDLDKPGEHHLKDAHHKLDAAVRACYGMRAADDALVFLLSLNQALVAKEASGATIKGPGLPQAEALARKLTSTDCLQESGKFTV